MEKQANQKIVDYEILKHHRVEGNNAILKDLQRMITFVKNTSTGNILVRIETIGHPHTKELFKVEDSYNYSKIACIAGKGYPLQSYEVQAVASAVKMFMNRN